MLNKQNVQKLYDLIIDEKNVICIIKKLKERIKNFKKMIEMDRYTCYDIIKYDDKLYELINIYKKNYVKMIKKKYNIIDDLNKLIKDEDKKYILNLISYIRITNYYCEDNEVFDNDWVTIEKVINKYEIDFVKNFIEFNFYDYIDEYRTMCKHDVKKYLDEIDIRYAISDTIINLFNNRHKFFNNVFNYKKVFLIEENILSEQFEYGDGYLGKLKVPDYFDDNTIWEGEKIVMVGDVEYSFISPTLNWVREKFKNEIENYIEFKMK